MTADERPMKYGVDEALVAKARSLGPVIREHAAFAERERRLAKPVVDALVQSGLTRMFLPRSLGGLETDPVTSLRVVEEVARFDGVAAWILMVTNGGTFFSARMPKATVEEMFRDPAHDLIATAFQPPVEAREVTGGYRLTGRRPFASGAHSARWVCLTGILMGDQGPKMVDGRPEIICALMPAEGVEIVDTWNGLGLRGSDSNDVSVRDLFVPSSWTCPLMPQFEPNEHYRGELYRFPILGAIVLASIAPIAIAVARNAIEEVRSLCAKRVPMGSAVPLRERGAAQARFGRAEGMLLAARALMYDTMSSAWTRMRAGETLTLQDRADLLLAATHAAQTGAEVTDMMFTSAGSSGVYVGQPIERLFRDAQVIRQHGFVCSARYETAAQVGLGLEPDLPLIHF